MSAILASLASVATIFGWSFFSFWSAIPAGIALGVTPIVVILTVTISYGSGAALVVLAGTPLRERIKRRMENRSDETSDEEEAKPNRMLTMVLRAWERYGLIGLAILAPMTVGSQAGAVIGLGFGESPRRLVIALTLGAGVWAVLITLVSYFTGESISAI